MFIEDLKEGEPVSGGRTIVAARHGEIGLIDVKRAAVGVGARALFYPTLAYNVVRNRLESGFHWWDEVDEFLLLGAVPFPSDVPCLKQLGVCGVITLNEPYETLVPTSLYQAHGVDHLMIPTRDYLFAPSLGDICQAVNFIHKNASCGKTTYVHCKAGRGRSTTIVLCYLVHHRQMTPAAAYDHVRLRRPRVLLAASQWKAVEEYYYHLRVKMLWSSCFLNYPAKNVMDDSSIIIVTEADLDGYNGGRDSGIVGNDIWEEVSLVYRVQLWGHSAIVRLSSLCLRCPRSKGLGKKKSCSVFGKKSCSVEAARLNCGPPRLVSGVGVVDP
ncbi:putative dual specificity protein phosphatase DSP8 [Acorus calamus]|uniref:phosphatidylglycerophosphatase n=1 Tax=Acorus calamus TaxID=4465 RepID=A0AAV9DVV1_ACOCL|nr:putative dual specificity protein phosphatase DSP8 [Acorus calamus]